MTVAFVIYTVFLSGYDPGFVCLFVGAEEVKNTREDRSGVLLFVSTFFIALLVLIRDGQKSADARAQGTAGACRQVGIRISRSLKHLLTTAQ
jgi:hypothetical protein